MHQLDRIEAMLTELTKKQEPAPPPPDLVSAQWVRRTLADLFGALTTDRKIEAIKAYRVMTGMGLKESKDAIENLCACLGRKAA